MKLRTRLGTALLAMVVLVLVQACSQAGNRSTASSTSNSDFAAETRLDTVEVEIKPAMRSNRLEIKTAHVDAGTLTLRLSTPEGEVQWEKTLTAPEAYKHTFDLDLTPGTWKLELQLENASGAYQVRWRASN